MLPINPFNQSPISFWAGAQAFTSPEISKIEQNLLLLPFQDALISNPDHGEQNDTNARSGRLKWIPQEQEWLWVYEKIYNWILSANNELYNFNLSFILEQIQYCEYPSTTGGHYDWHLDIGHQNHSLRKLSVIIQLSDSKEYEGGEVELFTGGEYQSDKTVMEKEKGSILVFPSYILHRVKPVTKGIRKSLVLWVGGNQFR